MRSGDNGVGLCTCISIIIISCIPCLLALLFYSDCVYSRPCMVGMCSVKWNYPTKWGWPASQRARDEPDASKLASSGLRQCPNLIWLNQIWDLTMALMRRRWRRRRRRKQANLSSPGQVDSGSDELSSRPARTIWHRCESADRQPALSQSSENNNINK